MQLQGRKYAWTLDFQHFRPIRNFAHKVHLTRYSVLLMAVELACIDETPIQQGGGCNITLNGRGVDFLLDLFQQAGARSSSRGTLQMHEVFPARINLKGPSVSATLSAIILTAGRLETTVLHNIALEPEITALVSFLKKFGASISLDTPNRILVLDCGRLSFGHTDIFETLIPDRIQFATYAALAVTTRVDLRITNVVPDHNVSFIKALERIGIEVFALPGTDGLVIRGSDPRKTGMCSNFFKALPYPGLPTDTLPFLAAIMLSLKQHANISDAVFPARNHFFKQISRLGFDCTHKLGKIRIGTSHSPIDSGICEGGDLRSTAALIAVSPLIKSGLTIFNYGQIHRGYNSFEQWGRIFDLEFALEY